MRYKSFNILIVTSFLIFTFSQCSTAKKIGGDKTNSKKLSYKSLVDSQHFVFVAESAAPLRGGFRNLTSEYDVAILNDTLKSFLPYFGRVFNPPYNPTESALDFTTVPISYHVSPVKKNGWQVSVKPKNKSDIQEYLFTIYDNGSAVLNVTSISRDAISFNGYIRRVQDKKIKKL